MAPASQNNVVTINTAVAKYNATPKKKKINNREEERKPLIAYRAFLLQIEQYLLLSSIPTRPSDKYTIYEGSKMKITLAPSNERTNEQDTYTTPRFSYFQQQKKCHLQL